MCSCVFSHPGLHCPHKAGPFLPAQRIQTETQGAEKQDESWTGDDGEQNEKAAVGQREKAGPARGHDQGTLILELLKDTNISYLLKHIFSSYFSSISIGDIGLKVHLVVLLYI